MAMTLRKTPFWIAIGFTLLLVAIGVGIAVGADSGGDPLARLSGTSPTTPATSQLSSGQERFALLRRAEVAGDALPASAFEGTYASNVAGANFALARRTLTSHGTVWAVPASGQTCLVASETGEASRSDDTCAPDAKAVDSGLWLSASHGSHEYVAGLVPDGTTSVEVRTTDGRVEDVAVDSNAFAIALDGSAAESITYTISGREVVIHP